VNFPVAATAPPQALRLPARGSLFWQAVAPLAALAAATLTMPVCGNGTLTQGIVYLAWGQAPILLAMCLTMGGLVLVARGRPLLGAPPRSGEDHETVGVHVQERSDLPETAAAELGQ
jgi:hypothetical protein